MLGRGTGGGTGFAMFTAYTEIAHQSPALLQRCVTNSLVDWRFQWTLRTLTPMRS